MTPGDTFVFAGEVLRFEGIQEDEVLATRTAPAPTPRSPSYAGGKFPLSTFLAARARDPGRSVRVGPPAAAARPNGCSSSAAARSCRARADLLVETFPRRNRHYLTCFPFEGRLAHQTLGMLLTRRLERAGSSPRLRRQRLWARGLGPRRHRPSAARRARLPRRALRRGHARRRPRGLARRIGADEAHLPLLRDHRRADRAPLSRARRRPGGRSRSRPISSTTCCASTSPTTCSCGPRGRMRQRDSST